MEKLSITLWVIGRIEKPLPPLIIKLVGVF